MTALWYPRTQTDPAGSGTGVGVTVTGDGTAHVKGAWVQLLSALAFDGYFLQVSIRGTRASATDTSALLDIGVDPAGGTSYTVVVPNIAAGSRVDVINSNPIFADFSIPVYIPSGSTVAARIQSVITTITAEVAVVVEGGHPTGNPIPVQGLVVDYGTNTSASTVVGLTNASANVEGAWTQIVASTTHPHRGLSVGLQLISAFAANAFNLIDIGIGASSSEVALIEDIALLTSSFEQIKGTFPSGVWIERPIPEGSRLSARAQSSTTNAQQDIGVGLYGWG